MAGAAVTDARKKETREKIALGGLIVKAGLRYEKRAVLLGALVELRRRLQEDEGARQHLSTIGAGAFGDEGE